MSNGKLWFTADTHFSQKRTLELSRRPFSNIFEMNSAIVENWNKIVSGNDLVYHLGDFGEPKIVRELNAKKIAFLPGNYDDDNVVRELLRDSRVRLIDNDSEWDFGMYSTGKMTKECDNIYRLVHEPDSGNYQDAFYLFGHIHKTQMVKKNGLNVGIDCHHYSPIGIGVVEFYRNAILNHYDCNVFMPDIGG